jgi:hypothetical protein
MLTILKLIELVILFLVIRFFIKMIPAFQKKQKPSSGSGPSTKRFETNGADISDGEYKEIRK